MKNVMREMYQKSLPVERSIKKKCTDQRNQIRVPASIKLEEGNHSLFGSFSIRVT